MPQNYELLKLKKRTNLCGGYWNQIMIQIMIVKELKKVVICLAVEKHCLQLTEFQNFPREHAPGPR